MLLCAAWLRDLGSMAGQACGMLCVVEDERVLAGDGHAAWSESFNEMFMQVADVFSNARVRRHGRAYVLGLLSQSERKNSWQLAEFAGDASPDGMQRLLNFSPWDEGAARDALRATSCVRWATRRRCWRWTRRDSLKRAACRPASPGSTRAPPGGSRTARSACSPRTSPRTGAGR